MKKLFLLKTIILMVVVSFLMTSVSLAQKKMSTEEFEIEKLKIEREAEKDKIQISSSAEIKKEEAKIKANAEIEKAKAKKEEAEAEEEKAKTMKEAEEMKIAADVEKEKAKLEADGKSCESQNKLMTGITVLNVTNTLTAFRDISLGLEELGNLEIKMGSKNAIDLTPKFQISISNPKFVEKSLELAPYEDKGFKWPYWASIPLGAGAGSVAWLIAYESNKSEESQIVAVASCGISAVVVSLVLSILTE